VWVWRILAGSGIGLLASTLGRLYSSTYYALKDTRTPLRFAVVRVTLTTILGVIFAFALPRWLGVDTRWGMAGLTASAGLAGWVEFYLLRRGITPRIGQTGVRGRYVAALWAIAALCAAAAYGLKLVFPPGHAFIRAAAILPIYGALYLALTKVANPK
jgi:putative peptidoglycan lipid II flippase